MIAMDSMKQAKQGALTNSTASLEIVYCLFPLGSGKRSWKIKFARSLSLRSNNLPFAFERRTLKDALPIAHVITLAIAIIVLGLTISPIDPILTRFFNNFLSIRLVSILSLLLVTLFVGQSVFLVFLFQLFRIFSPIRFVCLFSFRLARGGVFAFAFFAPRLKAVSCIAAFRKILRCGRFFLFASGANLRARVERRTRRSSPTFLTIVM